MKDYPLSFQIWLVISIITLLISALLVIILPHTLRDFFTDEMYSTIETAQDMYREPNPLYFQSMESDLITPEDDLDDPNSYDSSQRYELDIELDNSIDYESRRVQHFFISSDGNIDERPLISEKFLENTINEALKQKKSSKKYVTNIGDEKIFYIITAANREFSISNIIIREEGFLVSYLNDSYRDDLVRTLFKKLASLTLIILFLSWIPAILLSRHLSKPLVDLEKKVGNLTNRNWDEEIYLDRKDEIGKLGNSIDKLRQELIRQDKAEQSFLQNISHELKTPTMVIRSYTEAISDGIYPGGTLESSLEVIDEETLRLEEKIQSLLYLTKLDFLATEEINLQDFYLNDLINDTIERITIRRPDIELDIYLEDCFIKCDPEQMKLVLENILDNGLRYAESKIEINLTEYKNEFILKIWNDGPPIEEENLNTIFDKFHKGKDGVIGLGLSIVKRIIDIHGFSISAENENQGVSFYIIMNK